MFGLLYTSSVMYTVPTPSEPSESISEVGEVDGPLYANTACFEAGVDEDITRSEVLKEV